MKKLLLLFAIILSACEANFDELKDTDQRSVTFSFDLTTVFSGVLAESEGSFSLDNSSGLDSRHRVRITAHCYDKNGLVKSYTLFTTPTEQPEISFRHLDKNREYQFLFLADVVRFNSETDYYETWYQLKTTDLPEFYLTGLERSDTAKYNIVARSQMAIVPDNQNETVCLSPATYNGYILLTNTGNFDKVEGYVNSYYQWLAYSMKGKKKGNVDFVLYNLQHNNQFIIPSTLCLADKHAILKVKTHSSLGVDSATVNILNASCRPFVITFDCKTREIIASNYY